MILFRYSRAKDYPQPCGFGAECAAKISDAAGAWLKGREKRIAGADMPIRYHRSLDTTVVPEIDEIMSSIGSLV